ncbi:MAG: amidohydrolase family protein [Halioglobus sp.]|nr:amidohydrolase family protein [Halioglobus sp.]
MVLNGCDSPPPERYTQADINALATQREQEQQIRGKSIYGEHIYDGYRGLAALPWFGLDDAGQLLCIDDSIPAPIDVHCHLGMSVLFKPELDLQTKTPRVRHLLDCDAASPGSPFDLDIYANGNFSEEALSDLRAHTIAQGLWGSEYAATQTIPNLLREMDSMRVDKALLLPIKLGLPFGDTLTEDWRDAVTSMGHTNRLHPGLSVYPGAKSAIAEMREHAKRGARVMKLHPTVQRFYPDHPEAMHLYNEAERLGLVIFFHGGRAGIEPESSHPFAIPRHYEAALQEFPNVQFILGHGGARDGAAMLELATRHNNAWLGIHGQSLTRLEAMIQHTGGERLLFGTDWPFYHMGASLAKVLIATQAKGREKIRKDILRGNAMALFSSF